MSGRRTACLLGNLFLVLTALGGAPGCVGVRSGPRAISFSPDGQVVAFLWDEGLAEAWVDGNALTRNTYLFWSHVWNLDQLRCVQVVSCIGQPAECRSTEVGMAFSPDSRHLAVTAPPTYTLIIVDLMSGTHQRLRRPGEFVTSFAWLSDDEIGYVTHRPVGRDKTDRRFWTEKIGDGLASRRCILVEEGVETSASPTAYQPLEHWSPTGRYVLYMSPTVRGRLMLLDVVSGMSRAIGREGMHLEGISWHPCGTQAFCILDVTGDVGKPQAVVVDAASGNLQDKTIGFRRSFPGYPPCLQPLWTADGQYILANDGKAGGFLIRPEPWEVIPLGERIANRLACGSDTPRPWLFRLPVPGWVEVLPQGPARDFTTYAVDYEGHSIVPLPTAPTPPRGWALSPDGISVATVDWPKKVTIHALGNCLSPNASQPAATRSSCSTTLPD